MTHLPDLLGQPLRLRDPDGTAAGVPCHAQFRRAAHIGSLNLGPTIRTAICFRLLAGEPRLEA